VFRAYAQEGLAVAVSDADFGLAVATFVEGVEGDAPGLDRQGDLGGDALAEDRFAAPLVAEGDAASAEFLGFGSGVLDEAGGGDEDAAWAVEALAVIPPRSNVRPRTKPVKTFTLGALTTK